MTTTISPRRSAPPARGLPIEQILRRLAPPDLTNVAALRPDCAPRALTPEEALIAWRLGLPAEADPSREARAALALIGPAALSGPAARFAGYLTEAAWTAARGARRGA